MKFKILYRPDDHSNLTTVFLEPIWKKYFDIEPINPEKTYDPKKCAVWVKHLGHQNWHLPWKNQGHKVIIDNFWDSETTLRPVRDDRTLIMRMPNWSWYNESLWYQFLGYDSYRRFLKRKKFFFMPMRKALKHRDQIFAKMTSMLDDSLYSFVHRGKILPGDLDAADPAHQRYMNPEWYDTTQFSMVVESTIGRPDFISEKIFKPSAFQHAFIVWAGPMTLAYLKKQGFETFDHIVDESYDLITDNDKRLEKIYQEIRRLYTEYKSGKDLFTDAESIKRINHNFYQFYHPNVQDWFVEDGVMPIMEFLES